MYCIWQLKTSIPLALDFTYLVFPDCCVDIVIDINDTSDSVLVMTPVTSAVTLSLGRVFHYLGVRVFPGSWNNTWGVPALKIVSSVEPIPIQVPGLRKQLELYKDKPLHLYAKHLENVIAQLDIQFQPMPEYVMHLLQGIFVRTVANSSRYSTRQLARIVLEKTGFTPRELIRIGKMQRVLSDFNSNAYLQEYYDQPHFIREFKKISYVK
jgi:AraC-like DNA-binding protein